MKTQTSWVRDKDSSLFIAKLYCQTQHFLHQLLSSSFQRVIEQDQMIPVNPADCVPGELWPESSRLGSKHNNSLLRETLYSSYWATDVPVLCSHEKLCQGCSLHRYLWTDSLQKPIIASLFARYAEWLRGPGAGLRSIGWFPTYMNIWKPTLFKLLDISAIFQKCLS